MAAQVLLVLFLLGHQLAPVAHLATHRPDHTHGPEFSAPEPDEHDHDDNHGHHDDHDVDHDHDEQPAPHSHNEPLNDHGRESVSHFGDAGTTEASRPSRRLGFEWDADYRAAPWLILDGSVTYSQARFTDEAPEGDRIPAAIEGVASAGVTVTPAARWSGSLRWRYFGPRPLVEDNSVRSLSSHLFNLEGGVDGLHFHPVEPFTVRVALVASF